MVRNYKKKSERGSWSDGQMALAIKSVLEDGKCVKNVASEFGVPRSTLHRKIKTHQDSSPNQENPTIGFSCTFSQEQEEAFAREINRMENMLIPLTSVDVRRIAFKFAEMHKIPNNFNREEGLAGKDWLRGFMRRQQFSIRKAENTSAARAYGFNKEAVEEFFQLLKQLLEKHNFTPDRIFNVDETGISVVPKTSPKVLAKRGKRQVGGKTVAERGETVTAEMCMSAGGAFMPLMLIFPRVKENLKLLDDAPPGAWAEFHKTGYMQSDIFTRWFQRFITFSKAKPDNPVLLLLDGHVTHVKNLKVIELAKENGVEILCFPPHCTHKMQPLDVGFMAPFNSCFGKEISTLQRQNVPVNLQNLFSIFGRAFLKAAKMETAVNSFRKCGIYPFNPQVFSESDFATLNREETSSSSSNTINLESEARIAQYVKDIKDIMDSNPYAKPKQQLQSSQRSSQPSIQPNNSNQPGTSKSSNASEGEIRIPLSYIMQAKPLINFLSSCLNSNTESTAPEQFASNDVVIELPSSTLPQLPEQRQTGSVEATIPSAAESIFTSNGIMNNPSLKPQDIETKKRRRQGKAAIITEEEYAENLMAEKIKNMKKEKVEKTPVVPQAQERKWTSMGTLTTKKRKPLQNLSNQLGYNIITPSTSQQPLQMVDIANMEVLPLEENQIFIQQEDGTIIKLVQI